MSAEFVYPQHSGSRKAAILLLTLGDDMAREVFRRLSEDELKQLNRVAQQLNDISVGEVLETLEEFKRTFAGDYVPEKSAGQVFQFMLERGLGEDRAQALLQLPKEEAPFEFCNFIEVTTLARVLCNEHPQTGAIVISFFDPKRAAAVLELFPQELAAQVVRRIATLGPIDPDIIHEISLTLREELKNANNARRSGRAAEMKRNGEDIAVQMLKQMKEEVSEKLMTDISYDDQGLADQLRSMMFTFQDLIKLDSRSMQRLMREVDTRHLSVALRNADPELQDAFLSAISSRAAELLRDDMESGGPVRVADITAAQQQVLDVALRLDGEGVLILPRGEL